MKTKKPLTLHDFAVLGGLARWAGKTKKQRKTYMKSIRAKQSTDASTSKLDSEASTV